MRLKQKYKKCPKHRILFCEEDDCLKCATGHRNSWYVLDVELRDAKYYGLTVQHRQPRKEMPAVPVFDKPFRLLKDMGM